MRAIGLVSNELYQLSEWKQLDNFVYVAATGKSTRLSRSLCCRQYNYKFLSVDTLYLNGILQTTFSFNDISGERVHSAGLLVCSIDINGNVVYRWS